MTSLTSTIDRLGVLNTQLAQIENEMKTLKAVMVEAGTGTYQGDVYSVTVTKPYTTEKYDEVAKEKIAELILQHTTVQYRTAHTVFTQVKPSVRVAVRKDVEVAA